MQPDPLRNARSLLNTFYPGSFPDPLHLPIDDEAPAPERVTHKLPGSLISTERAAQYLDISSETLRRLCKRKVITFIRVTPHEYRFDPVDLEEYKNSRRNR